MDRPAIKPRRDHPGRRLRRRRAPQLDQLADAARALACRQMVGAARTAGQREHRISDEVHRHDIDGRRAPRWDRRICAARECLHRAVEHVERRSPPRARVAHHDARSQDLNRKPPTSLAHQELGLELAALIRVSEVLPDVEILLAEVAGVRARDIRRRHVSERPEATAPRAQPRELDHAPGPVDVDSALFVDAHRERHRRGAVKDAICSLGEPVPVAPAHPKPGMGDVAANRDRAVRPRLGAPEQRLEERPQTRVGVLGVLGADQHVDGVVIALEEPHQHLAAEKAGPASQQSALFCTAHLTHWITGLSQLRVSAV